MEDKIKGIALLLFGILLSCAQDGLNDTIFASMSDIPFAFVGLFVGIAGLYLVFGKSRTNNCHFVPGQPAACSLACSCYNSCIQICLPYRQLNQEDNPMLDSRWASIDAFAENNRDNILRDITRLVAVPSVEGTPEPGAPFGKGPKAALDKALEIAAELGLDTHNAEGYIGWAQTGPIADGQKYLATITHTDVVPEGNGWDADPYTVRVRDGWLLGRGVADDKGPSILCLYALKYLKDNGVTLKYPVRALLGANEETNMHDVDYFAAHFEQPAFCFTPDAEFPVCNGEKGGFGGELVSPVLENGVIVDFVGGVAHNAVPDRAACTVRLPESALKQTEGVTFEAGENGTTIIRGWGKSGHAAMPQGTVNAIGLIVTCLLESKVCSPAETAYL